MSGHIFNDLVYYTNDVRTRCKKCQPASSERSQVRLLNLNSLSKPNKDYPIQSRNKIYSYIIGLSFVQLENALSGHKAFIAVFAVTFFYLDLSNHLQVSEY